MPFDPALALEMTGLVRAAVAQYRDGAADLPDGWVQQFQVWGWDGPARGVAPVPMGFVARKDDTLAVAFRGTANNAEWIDDFTFTQRRAVLFGRSVGVHEGFDALAFNLRAGADSRAPDAVTAIIKRMDVLGGAAPRLVIAGHSLGGAIATLLAAELAPFAPTVFTYGSPRVGDAEFATAFSNAIPDSWRLANRLDLVPHLPPANMLGLTYWHVEETVEFDGAARFWRDWHSLDCYADWLQGQVDAG